MNSLVEDSVAVLFEPQHIGALQIRNRLAMAPMTRAFSPGGVPGADVAAYYARRAAGGIGLIITEGTWIPHPSASNDENVPRFYGEEALAGWKNVVNEVHAAGGRIVPQLWHIGQIDSPRVQGVYEEAKSNADRQVGPSGMVGSFGVLPSLRGKPATLDDIEAIVEAYATAAETAKMLGFDGIELHGAHGYLIDQFHWTLTNLRDDEFGGTIRERTRFACAVVSEIRRRTGPDFPIIMRMSQWKLQDYNGRLANSPGELADILEPMAAAGVDAFHCSQRRFWEGEFDSELNLAAWAKKITGLPSISVGSVSLKTDFLKTMVGETSDVADVKLLVEMIGRGDFDMIAIGRALLVDPNWAQKIRIGAIDEIEPYTPDALASLT